MVSLTEYTRNVRNKEIYFEPLTKRLPGVCDAPERFCDAAMTLHFASAAAHTHDGRGQGQQRRLDEGRSHAYDVPAWLPTHNPTLPRHAMLGAAAAASPGTSSTPSSSIRVA